MITADALNNGHALSITNQPSLGELVRDLSTSATPVTFVVGAGVSIDSGFPTWRDLILRLAQGIGDEDLARLSVREDDDLRRKAEYVIQLYQTTRKVSSPEDAIWQVLYSEIPGEPQPGAVAMAVCQLIADLGPERASVITTNFDEVLSIGLARGGGSASVRQFTLSSKDDWKLAVQDPAVLPILHLHGVVGHEMTRQVAPVILTESHFFRYGQLARRLVRQALNRSHVLFLGVSLTDPNLVGPLWDTRESRANGSTPKAYVLSVPDSVSGVSIETSRRFMLEKHDYLESELHVNFVWLKSYLQLEQALRELSIANVDPDQYFRSASGWSYGRRLTAALDACRGSLGCTPGASVPLGDASLAVSRALMHELEATSLPHRVRPLLTQFTHDNQSRLLQLKADHSDTVPADREVFALHLWLRSTLPPGRASYAVDLVGSSSSARLAESERQIGVTIEPRSRFVVSRALYSGQNSLDNVDQPGAFWKGILAAPVRRLDTLAHATGALSATVTVGAVTLATNFNAVPGQPKEGVGGPVSILATLDAAQMVELAGQLELAARRVLGL